MTFQAERELICRIGKLLYDRGYVASNDGTFPSAAVTGSL